MAGMAGMEGRGKDWDKPRPEGLEGVGENSLERKTLFSSRKALSKRDCISLGNHYYAFLLFATFVPYYNSLFGLPMIHFGILIA